MGGRVMAVVGRVDGGKPWGRRFRLKPSRGAQRSHIFSVQVTKSNTTGPGRSSRSQSARRGCSSWCRAPATHRQSRRRVQCRQRWRSAPFVDGHPGIETKHRQPVRQGRLPAGDAGADQLRRHVPAGAVTGRGRTRRRPARHPLIRIWWYQRGVSPFFL